jgi:long-chain acyl-CoA synthetase
MDLAKFINMKAEKYSDNILLKGPEGNITYKEFNQRSDRIAIKLNEIGVKMGDRVAVLHPNSHQTLLAYCGIIKSGAAAVPVNSIYTPREIAYILNNSGAVLLITRKDLLPVVEEIRAELPGLRHLIVRSKNEQLESALARMTSVGPTEPRQLEFEPDQAAMIFYTSGTTGFPKGVVISHRNLYFGGPNVAQNYGLREDDVALAVLPMVHVFCVASPIFGAMSSGGSVVVLEAFNTDRVLEAIDEYGVTWFPGVPTMFNYLLGELDQAKHSMSSLRMGLSGGASLPMEVRKQWEDRFGAKIIDAYGLTESTGLVTTSPLYGRHKQGSIGITVSGVDAKLVDEDGEEVPSGQVGNLIFRGPNATSGYWQLPEENAAHIKNGWFYTGDHAYRDEEGFFFIVGREQELIITGGYNIYPREIEEIIYTHPAVNEAAVIGVPHPTKGEVPKAYVVLNEGKFLSPEQLVEYCRKNLAPYKKPLVDFVNELPKNPTGKILKDKLPKKS